MAQGNTRDPNATHIRAQWEVGLMHPRYIYRRLAVYLHRTGPGLGAGLGPGRAYKAGFPDCACGKSQAGFGMKFAIAMH